MLLLEPKSKEKLNTEGFSKKRFKELLLGGLDFVSNKKNLISRHYWHAFPAKFPPDLPKIFIEHLTEEGDTVLDPMAGSCTTIIEAINLKRNAIGFDIDPLSLKIGKAKIQNIDINVAKEEGAKVLESARKLFQNEYDALIDALEKRYDAETLNFLNFWFLKETQIELLCLIGEIEKVKQVNVKDFLTLIFSSIIITKSGGVTQALDLAHTRPHKVLTKIPNSAFVEFSKKLNKILNNGYRYLPQLGTLFPGNTKAINLGSEVIDLIVTSPPYANNAIDYMRAHKFSLVWFDHTISELKFTRKKYIGSDTLDKNELIDLPEYATKIVGKLSLINKSKGNALHRYYSEMLLSMKEMFRVLKRERACVLVVATSILNGIDVETHFCLSEIGKSIGFELIHIGNRNIPRDSRMLPTSHKKSDSQIEARMHKEFIIGLWKP